MSTALDRPKISAVVEGLNPRASPQSGITASRAARTTPTNDAAVPTVSRTERCDRITSARPA